MVQKNSQNRCFELKIDGYPGTPVIDLDDLKSRIGLSREFLRPELWARMERALTAQEENPQDARYVRFLLERDQNGAEIIIWVYSEVHGVLVDVRQREYNTPLDIPEETFLQAIRDGLRDRIKECLLGYGVEIP